MKSLKITNFKGINDSVEIKFTKKDGNAPLNLVLYSENGGGKTSISEAIRVAYLSDEEERAKIPAHIVGQEYMQAQKSLYMGMLNDRSKSEFQIDIDDSSSFVSTHPVEIHSDGIAILNREDLIPCSKLNLKNIVKKTNIKIGIPFEELLSPENVSLIIDEANQILKDKFKENIGLIRLSDDGSLLGITGIKASEHFSEGIDKVLNEARQNIVKLVLFICCLKFIPTDKYNNCLIVFDDVMSSLDLENRIILARCFTDLGRTFQIFILTHNVGFYNLMKHTISIENENDNWKFSTMYPYDNRHEIIDVGDENRSVNTLLEKYGGTIRPSDKGAINELRKLLEYQLHELGKILSMGVQEETKDLLQCISTNRHNAYLCAKGSHILTHRELLSSIKYLSNCLCHGQIG